MKRLLTMKKIILTMATLLVALSTYAGIDFPSDFSKEFGFTGNQLQGWTVYAPAGTPSGEYAGAFENYSPTNAVTIAAQFEYDTVGFAWTNSEYTNSQPSDTWLITPEFEVTADTEVLAFSVSVIGMTNLVSNKYSIYVSESGVQKEDFKLYYQSEIHGSIFGAFDFETSDRRIAFSGYKGKKIRIAFVNEDNFVGIMGFGSISLSSWYASGYPDGNTFEEMLLDDSGSTSISFTMKASTPVTTTSFDVDFKTSKGFTYHATERRQLRLAQLTTLQISVPDIRISGATEDFTLTVTPDFEGAQPFVVTGSFIKAQRLYDQVAVLEEGTGTWCIWCPYGAAALGYYTDKYPASGDGNKVIGIAIHDSDPMQIPGNISDYYEQFIYQQKIDGFPMVSFNRSANVTPSPLPNVFGPMIEQQFSQKSFLYAKINKVYLNPDDSSDMMADFSVNATYDTNTLPLKALVVVVEDNVQNSAGGYIQKTCVANNETAASISSNLGSDWLPYFEIYLENKTTVPASKMQYNHVARAAYPSYGGVMLPGREGNVTFNGQIEFGMPSNVQIQSNTKVILLITDAQTGEILTADEMKYDDFTMTSGVDTVSAGSEAFVCVLNGSQLRITSTADCTGRLYTVDGRLIDTLEISRGVNTFPVSANGSMMILKADGPGIHKTVKLF